MSEDLVLGEGVLGQQVRGARRQLDRVPLEQSVSEVRFTSDEIYSHCPVTGQPDFYTATIHITEPTYSIESKSLKLVLQSFADPEDAQFCEKFADTICREVARATEAHFTSVFLKQKPRGGISIEAHATIDRIVSTVEELT
jgi:7-cyano-7-deazaguanine reductase